jgi:hypothetical protein
MINEKNSTKKGMNSTKKRQYSTTLPLKTRPLFIFNVNSYSLFSGISDLFFYEIERERERIKKNIKSVFGKNLHQIHYRSLLFSGPVPVHRLRGLLLHGMCLAVHDYRGF